MTLMFLPFCKIWWWWGHSSPSIMRGIWWGNAVHARQGWVWRGTCCTIHAAICLLLESLAPPSKCRCQGCVTGPIARTAGASGFVTGQASVLGLSFIAFLQLKQPCKGYLHERRKCVEANKHQGTSTVKTEINKEIRTAETERGHQDFRDNTWNINAAQIHWFLYQRCISRVTECA